MRALRPVFLLAAVVVIAGCSESEPTVEGRWYTASQVARGTVLYDQFCIGCHGVDAQGTAEWHQPLADGRYPPPPLNGTAHTWHHPLKGLKKTIEIGGVPLGGSMPAFGNQVSEAESEALISYLQSHWPDPVYQAWLQRGGLQ